MDSINNRDNLFSRGPSPPPTQPFAVPPPQPKEQSPSPPLHTASSALDSLFHNLTSPPPQQPSSQPLPPTTSTNPFVNAPPPPPEVPQSGPATPASVNAASVSSGHSAPHNADRQNALLSLLGAVSSPPMNSQPIPLLGPTPPQQVPTPPGSAPRMGPSNNESQGKLLLEQLMSGASKYNNDMQPQPFPSLPSSGGPSPTYLPQLLDSQTQNDGIYYGPEPPSQEMSQLSEQTTGQSAQRPPSPARRSMFDFVSPFDALGPQTAPPKPPVAPVDPKRKSVENLIDQLTRGQAPPPPPSQSITAQFDPYAPNEEFTPVAEPQQSRAPRPLPPQPNQAGSPRATPPKPVSQQQRPPQQRRPGESPVGHPMNQGPFQPQTARDKESSPLPPPMRQYVPKSAPKSKGSPIVQQQSIIFDVSQPLDEVQAPQDSVKSTAIALVKVDSTFLPGTTIGATHWVAYAMTKGRVRVISRSSGDRTLLQLPPLFPNSVAVSDMSVHGNRLAGVTSDGGFVVWELPEVIRDDVPGTIVLCVLPSQDLDPLHAVKWHPRQPDLVAVASETNVYLINIADALHMFGGEPIPQSELHRVGQIFSVPSPIIAFDFDVPRNALATISEDSTLTMWNIRDKLPFWSHKIPGDDLPSSLIFVEGGVVVGRKNGTIFQLLSVMGRNVLSTVKFVNGTREDPDMFGHANYDSRIQTLWIANNKRDSMIAFMINFDVATPSPGGDEVRGPYFDQVVEFGGPKPTIHFVILTADADPTGEEAHAACVAAKVNPGELALVAFSVHSSGVDQLLIRKEWYHTAVVTAPSKFPNYLPPAPEPKPQRQQQQYRGPPVSQGPPPPPPVAAQPARLGTPPSEDIEGLGNREEPRVLEGKKFAKGKKVDWRDSDNSNASNNREAKGKQPEINVANESPLGLALTKEIRKVEESLHTRIGRLIGKELDKQHQRLEDARANEQAADFVRQEKILKLISTELTKNTTRVVEMAVKAEVQSSVLPALENITKNEVRFALNNNNVVKGVSDSLKQTLPTEIERLLLRSDVSNHIARTFSSAVTPLVERQVKETITKNLIPAYSQQSSAMHQELSHEIHTEILNLKKEIVTWQSEALRGQEAVIRDLEQSIRLLSDQVKYLTMNVSSSQNQQAQRNSPVQPQSNQGNLSQLLRHPNLPPVQQQPQSYQQSHAPFQPHQQQPQMQGPWFGPNVAAPQASHPVAPPHLSSHSQPTLIRTPPPVQSEEWDDTYLAVLGSQDTRQLRELLARSNPDVIMPLNGNGPLSQAVVLTLVHRLSAVVGETPPVDESFKPSMWWLQRAATALNTSDPLISPYVSRVLPSVQQMLNTTKQRLAILPGGPLMDTARTISEVQDMLARKPM